MGKKYSIFLIFIMFCQFTYGQNFMPFSAGNTSGLMAQRFQPASMAGSLHTAEYLFGSPSLSFQSNAFSFGNDYWFQAASYRTAYNLRNSYFTPGSFSTLINDPQRALSLYPGSNQFVNNEWDINVLSIGYSLDQISALSFGYGYRGFLQINGFSKELFQATHMATTSLNDLPQDTTTGGAIDMNSASWEQFYVNYARVYLHTPNHYLRVGLTGKVAINATSGFFHADSYKIEPYQTNATAKMHYDGVHAGSSDDMSYGVATDFGVEYQYRPDFMQKESVPYLAKFGVSITDFGYLQFRKATNRVSQQLTGWSSYLNMNTDYDLIARQYGKTEVSRTYAMSMPTMVHGMLDIQLSPLVKNVFLFAGASYGMYQGSKTNLSKASSVVVVPRYDQEWFEVGIPVRYSKPTGTQVGFSARLWTVLWLGSSNIFTQVSKKNTSSADIHLALRLPFPWTKQKDRDWDGTPDVSDKCPDNFGKRELKGCPDRDDDGVPDYEDACPDEKGLKRFKGCPRTPVKPKKEEVKTVAPANEPAKVEIKSNL